MTSILARTLADVAELLPKLASLEPQLSRLSQAMLDAWAKRSKVLLAGNGGSAADAMHFAEDLCVRFQKDRRALAAMALCDPTVMTCAANDYGFDQVFSRQVEAFGNPGDVFIGLTTSGNSPNILRAVKAAKSQGLTTVAFLGKDGGQLKGFCDIELLVPSNLTARVQEAHKILYHAACEWVESKL